MPVQTTQYKLPKNMRFCCDDFIKDSIQFLRKQRKKRNARKLIVGLSGGIDSAVVAILCKQKIFKILSISNQIMIHRILNKNISKIKEK